MRTLAFVACCVLGLALVFAVRTASAGCCGGDDPKTPAKAADGAVIAQKLCPVMGNAINPKLFVDYKGRRVYFCCGMCPAKFNQDPEKYLKIVDEQLKAAKQP